MNEILYVIHLAICQLYAYLMKFIAHTKIDDRLYGSPQVDKISNIINHSLQRSLEKEIHTVNIYLREVFPFQLKVETKHLFSQHVMCGD